MKTLFLKIFEAIDEEELHKIISTDKNLNDPNNWRPYGDNNNNFATFQNQQSNSVPALVEKITNSIDAMLLKQCRIMDIIPTGKNAPQTMSQAVEKFFGIKNGDFSEVSPDDRRSIAADIQLITTGDKQSPNLLIYDDGEGQHPGDFPDTFLSLFRGNKKNIPFVQGIYNMGSTGAVVFCGKYRYQLIGSRRHPNFNNGKSDEFGFTIVRRHPLSIQEEDSFTRSWYEYFVINGEVPRFNIGDGLDLGLWKRNFLSGSIVKLYSYELPRGVRSDITLDLWRDLNQFLYHPALPILLYERRFKGGHSPSKLMLGNKTRLIIDERDKKEITIPLAISGNNFGSINLEVTIFKHDIKQTEFIKEKAVIFTLNGQVHATLPRSFISQYLGFSMLRDSMLVHVDCTNMRTSFRQDLFMASRDRLNEGEKTQILSDKIVNVLKVNETIKEINQNRKNIILRESSEDRDLIKTIMSNLPIDKDLLNLLKRQGDLDFLKKYAQKTDSDIKKSVTDKEKPKPYTSKRFPSIFKIELKEGNDGRKIKSIPLNGKGVINFETNAEDEYLFRPKDKGELKIQILSIKRKKRTVGDGPGPTRVEDVFDVTKAGPTNHAIKVTFEPKTDISVGDEIELNARLSSPSGDFQSIFWIKIVEPQKEVVSQKKPPKEDTPSLPTPIKVFEHATTEGDYKTWQDYAWSGEDIVRIISGENIVEAIAINMDCHVLKRYVSKYKISSPEQIKLAKDKFFLSVYFHSLFLYSILNKLGNADKNNKVEFDSEDLIPLIFKPYSSFLLSANTDQAILASLKED